MTFTKEQLVEYVKGCIEHAERFPGVEIADKEKEIFEIALAALTAEPVGVARLDMDWTTHRNICTVDMRPDLVLSELNTGMDLYTAPPVPVVPVVPDGYALVPMKLTAENGAKGALLGEFSETKFINCPECFGDGECETCDGSGRIGIKVPVNWTTIKEIWAKGVEHFAAAPQQEADNG